MSTLISRLNDMAMFELRGSYNDALAIARGISLLRWAKVGLALLVSMVCWNFRVKFGP